jgi:hypothetical protein
MFAVSGPPIDIDAASFARAEFERVMIADESVSSLCIQGCREFLPSRAEAAPIIAKQLISLIKDEIPASLIRVGDGEGNALGLAGPQTHPIQLETFNSRFFDQNGTRLREDDARAFSEMIRAALISADIIGFRSFESVESKLIPLQIECGVVGGGLGMLYAREFLQNELARGEFCRKTLTSAWIHLALIPYLSEIVSAAKRVVVITGRTELKEHFERRLGGRLHSFLSVPLEGYRPMSEHESHYHSAFPRILQALDTDLRGTLALVGAGFFGKVYCQAAKKAGAVAVDLGSAFDVLAGISSRSIHSKVDIQSLRWM